MQIEVLDGIYHYLNTTGWFVEFIRTLAAVDSQQVVISVRRANIGPRFRMMFGPRWDGEFQWYHIDTTFLGSDDFPNIFGLYLFLTVLGRPESQLDDAMRSTFAQLPSDLQLTLRTRLSEAIKRREEERVAALREKELVGALREEERVAALRDEEQTSVLLGAGAGYLAALAAVVAESKQSNAPASALLSEQLEVSATRFIQAFMAFTISKLAMTVSLTELPRVKCSFRPDIKTLHIDLQIPVIDNVGAPTTAKEVATARRSIMAFMCLNILRNLMGDGIGAVIRQIYLDAYVVKASRLSGELRRRYALSVCLDDDNADTLFIDGLDACETILRMGGRVAREPGVDTIKCIRGLQPATDNVEQRHPLEITPAEFETLVATLFRSLGFAVEQTSGSWDGGVDCIAIDPRPLVGGRILVQAKRFAGTVDVSVVRDLYGLVLSQGASKGVIVTTGTFGPTSRDFIIGKPLELIDGAQLAKFLDASLPERDG